MTDKKWAIGYDGWLHDAESRQPWPDKQTPNQPPKAVFAVSSENLVVTVDAAGSSDPDGTIVSYSWNWGDGTTNGSGVKTTHTYATAGSYNISLTVTDNHGATDSTTRSVNLTAAPQPDPGYYDTGLPRQVFAASSFWYKPLPTSTPLDAQSSNRINYLIERGIARWGSPQKGFPSWTANYRANTPSILVANNSDPLINIEIREDAAFKNSPYGRNLVEMFKNVRMPADAVVTSTGSDKFLDIYNVDTDEYWDCWIIEKNAPGYPGWSTKRGQKIAGASTKLGVAEPYANGTGAPFYYGTNAAGLAQEPGIIKAQELAEGHIKHAISMAIPIECVADRATRGISAPAVRSDGASLEPHAIMMGQRLRLPASLNLDQFNFHPVTKAFARCFQEYGCFVVDRAGDCSFGLENAADLPAGTYDSIFAGASAHNVMWDYGGYDPFPWQHLQVLAPNYLP